jgi:FkbM family methyltransferase
MRFPVFKKQRLNARKSVKEAIRNLSQLIYRLHYDFKFLRDVPTSQLKNCFKLLRSSKSQLRQDLIVLCQTNFKRNGYFLEIGAASGCQLSNTYLLEQKFSWTGILVEPAKVWHNQLRQNRPNSEIETMCVWSESGLTLEFHETTDPELSTIEFFGIADQSVERSQKVRSYEVSTISFTDLLAKNKAPKFIDYLSLDTEGSEFEILRTFDFDEYRFGVITCEHNYGPNRQLIYDLLTRNGYSRIHQKISLFDDWYIKN